MSIDNLENFKLFLKGKLADSSIDNYASAIRTLSKHIGKDISLMSPETFLSQHLELKKKAKELVEMRDDHNNFTSAIKHYKAFCDHLIRRQQ